VGRKSLAAIEAEKKKAVLVVGPGRPGRDNDLEKERLQNKFW
jgi:hypothetical protein